VYDTTAAIQRDRKSGSDNGAQAESGRRALGLATDGTVM